MGADHAVVADLNRSENGNAHVQNHVVAYYRIAFFSQIVRRRAQPPQGYVMQYQSVASDAHAATDCYSGRVPEVAPRPDLRARVYLRHGEEVVEAREDLRDELKPHEVQTQVESVEE